MADVNGTCDPKFAELREILAASIDSGADVGASIAVVLDDDTVVDLWGGWVDEARTEPWTDRTITNVWSTTKTMVALSALLLVERGRLDPFAPVATYWPEFAENGKEAVEVRHLMSHTSGVSAWEQPVTYDDLYDWERSTAMLARSSCPGCCRGCPRARPPAITPRSCSPPPPASAAADHPQLPSARLPHYAAPERALGRLEADWNSAETTETKYSSVIVEVKRTGDHRATSRSSDRKRSASNAERLRWYSQPSSSMAMRCSG
jgi:hypothetical protein